METNLYLKTKEVGNQLYQEIVQMRTDVSEKSAVRNARYSKKAYTMSCLAEWRTGIKGSSDIREGSADIEFVPRETSKIISCL